MKKILLLLAVVMLVSCSDNKEKKITKIITEINGQTPHKFNDTYTYEYGKNNIDRCVSDYNKIVRKIIKEFGVYAETVEDVPHVFNKERQGYEFKMGDDTWQEDEKYFLVGKSRMTGWSDDKISIMIHTEEPRFTDKESKIVLLTKYLKP